jgi:WD repeat-containing protein 68
MEGFEQKLTFDHEYPPTKIMWIPDTKGTQKDLIASTGEYLRIWEVGEDTKKVTLKSKLQNNKQS